VVQRATVDGMNTVHIRVDRLDNTYLHYIPVFALGNVLYLTTSRIKGIRGVLERFISLFLRILGNPPFLRFKLFSFHCFRTGLDLHLLLGDRLSIIKFTATMEERTKHLELLGLS
jgi:hypothetical protein